MRKLLISAAILASLASGCSVHKLDIQQGNLIDDAMLAQLKPGMSKRQVRFVLGEPLLVDPFRDNRWDYVHYTKVSRKITESSRVTLHFDNDELTEIIKRRAE